MRKHVTGKVLSSQCSWRRRSAAAHKPPVSDSCCGTSHQRLRAELQAGPMDLGKIAAILREDIPLMRQVCRFSELEGVFADSTTVELAIVAVGRTRLLRFAG